MEQWYVLRVRSNFEKVAQAALRQQAVEEFLPLYRKTSRWSDRVKVVERPLFPGYIFGRFDACRRLPILQIPGVVHILGNSAGPIAIEDEEVYCIRQAAYSGLPVMPWPYLAAGDRIVVEQGVLAGLQGLLVREKDTSRVVVSLTLLHRSVAVELDRDSVRPAGPARGRTSEMSVCPAA